jgi:hypothetical protein
MKSLKTLFRTVIVMISLLLITMASNSQEIVERSISVNGRQDYGMYTGGEYLFWDEFTIIGASGITWLRVIENNPMNALWESSFRVLYDGVPVIGQTTKTVKRPPPCEGCGWEGAPTLSLMALGEGTLTLRLKKLLGDPPYPIEGEYLDKGDWGTFADQSGGIVATPNSAQPGNTVNIRVTIPNRMRQHISGVTLQLPTGPDAPNNFVTLPYDIDGVYDYTWTVPTDIPYFEKLNMPHQAQINFTATSNRRNENGQFYTITGGYTFITIASTLYVRMVMQGNAVELGSNNTWVPNRPRNVAALIQKGQEPFKIRWIVNGQEVNLPSEYMLPFGRNRILEDQNVLADAGTITFEVTDANGNTASGTIYVGVKTGMDFVLSVQGNEVKPGTTINWREASQKIVTTRQVVTGQLPYRTRWLINGNEYLSATSSAAMYQFNDQEILDKATSITFEVTDANNVQKSYTIYIGNQGGDKSSQPVPAGPIGPAPTPPPLTGNPNREPNPDVQWNNRPWMDERVRQCVREYLQNIVLYVENEYVKWENTGLDKNNQRALFTSIDDWGRLLNQFITTSGGVDGSWDNPTHFVWSAYNKPAASERYGRTVDYFCKYECNLLEPAPADIDDAIKDVSGDNENNKWDAQRVRNALNDLNDLLNQARLLYNQFNTNYNKFVSEINKQRSDPLQNEIIALCLANSQSQYDDHSVNKDTLNVHGNILIAQSANNKDIDLFEIIRIFSEVQVQSDDMNKKLGEMKNLLTVRGGDIDEIIATGQNLIAQGNINPEFAQDGGVNVEFSADGVDNFGDGLQDFLFGNTRRGNVLIVVWDGGNIADDIFEVIMSGRGSLGTTPPGGRRNFDITLTPGIYTLTIKGVYTDPNSPPCTFGLQVYDRDLLVLQEANSMEQGQELSYTITIR